MNKTALENEWIEVSDIIASSHRIYKFNDSLCFFAFLYYKEKQEFPSNCYL